jgi:hypothetical protein
MAGGGCGEDVDEGERSEGAQISSSMSIDTTELRRDGEASRGGGEGVADGLAGGSVEVDAGGDVGGEVGRGRAEASSTTSG